MLATDWTLLRLFPPLRAMWAPAGAQASVPISGANARRVLFGAINLVTARRAVLIRRAAGQADAQAFFCDLRRRYRRAGTIWLLLDGASGHTAATSQRLAAAPRRRARHRPRVAAQAPPGAQPDGPALARAQAPGRRFLRNRQAASIDALAVEATAWVLGLTPTQARRKAGMAAPQFWLRRLLQDFWPDT